LKAKIAAAFAAAAVVSGGITYGVTSSGSEPGPVDAARAWAEAFRAGNFGAACALFSDDWLGITPDMYESGLDPAGALEILRREAIRACVFHHARNMAFGADSLYWTLAVDTTDPKMNEDGSIEYRLSYRLVVPGQWTKLPLVVIETSDGWRVGRIA